MSRADAATRLGITTRTLDKYIQSGRLPALRIGPRAIRIREPDLVAFVASCLIDPPKRRGRTRKRPA